MTLRARRALAWALALGPGLAALAWVALRWGPGPAGLGPALLLGALVGLGVTGLMSVLLAWLPWSLERLGATGLAAWLRRHGDPDAR